MRNICRKLGTSIRSVSACLGWRLDHAVGSNCSDHCATVSRTLVSVETGDTLPSSHYRAGAASIAPGFSPNEQSAPGPTIPQVNCAGNGTSLGKTRRSATFSFSAFSTFGVHDGGRHLRPILQFINRAPSDGRPRLTPNRICTTRRGHRRGYQPTNENRRNGGRREQTRLGCRSGSHPLTRRFEKHRL